MFGKRRNNLMINVNNNNRNCDNKIWRMYQRQVYPHLIIEVSCRVFLYTHRWTGRQQNNNNRHKNSILAGMNPFVRVGLALSGAINISKEKRIFLFFLPFSYCKVEYIRRRQTYLQLPQVSPVFILSNLGASIIRHSDSKKKKSQKV